MHPRNRHKDGYDFPKLIAANPELKRFVIVNKYNNQTIDFSDAEAVKALNKALLKTYYGISFWEIPKNYLTPPVPGRADYIHHLHDLIGDKVRVLDVGTGANCIYPIIGSTEYGWSFVGSDIDVQAVTSAAAIAKENKLPIELRHQTDPKKIFQGIIKLMTTSRPQCAIHPSILPAKKQRKAPKESGTTLV